MPELPYLGDIVNSFSPLIVVVIVVVAVLFAARWLLLRDSLNLEGERKLSRNLALVGMGLFGLVVIILALPVAANTRQQLLTIVGLIGSGVIALSSTTIVANAMAGLMLRVTKRFRTGDFISVEEQFGRVTKRGLLDTEIQTEDRELTSLPNLYLITNPVSVVRSSGTIVSATLTLGYDVHHARVEPLLMEAAKQVKLEEPFVWIMELGNFSVTYRISGFLADIKSLLSARSNLCKSILDVLHEAGIEIMSPTIMNQRPMPAEMRVIPNGGAKETEKATEHKPEDILFDKAEEAEQHEKRRIQLTDEIKELEEKLKKCKTEEKSQLEHQLVDAKSKLEKYKTAIDEDEQRK